MKNTSDGTPRVTSSLTNFSGNIWEAGLFRNSNKESRLYIFFPSGLHGTENEKFYTISIRSLFCILLVKLIDGE